MEFPIEIYRLIHSYILERTRRDWREGCYLNRQFDNFKASIVGGYCLNYIKNKPYYFDLFNAIYIDGDE